VLGESHIVVAGDTLSAIARSRGVELEALAGLNQLSSPSMIFPGQRLKLPEQAIVESSEQPVVDGPATVASSPSRPPHHAVQPGENLYRISLRYGLSLNELLAANPTVDPRKLRIGQKVRLPAMEPMLAGGR